ncbi:MAG: hypothetical protein J7K35_06530, partial [Syntrophobacterales bacterium]|nr:hypothetical protein [Syntrophobacterales bacterium]
SVSICTFSYGSNGATAPPHPSPFDSVGSSASGFDASMADVILRSFFRLEWHDTQPLSSALTNVAELDKTRTKTAMNITNSFDTFFIPDVLQLSSIFCIQSL